MTRRLVFDGLKWPHLDGGDQHRLLIIVGRRVGSRVELFAAIRHDERVEGLSIRGLSEQYHLDRCTVRQASESAILRNGRHSSGRRRPEPALRALGSSKGRALSSSKGQS